jgi:hypothetical protein
VHARLPLHHVVHHARHVAPPVGDAHKGAARVAGQERFGRPLFQGRPPQSPPRASPQTGGFTNAMGRVSAMRSPTVSLVVASTGSMWLTVLPNDPSFSLMS